MLFPTRTIAFAVKLAPRDAIAVDVPYVNRTQCYNLPTMSIDKSGPNDLLCFSRGQNLTLQQHIQGFYGIIFSVRRLKRGEITANNEDGILKFSVNEAMCENLNCILSNFVLLLTVLISIL